MSSLTIASYNCKNFNGIHSALKKSFVNNLVKECDFTLLQEHWLLESQFHVFDYLSSGNNVICIEGCSAMDIDRIGSGRPHGGCAILWKSNIKYKVSNIHTVSNRLNAILVEMDDVNYFLVFNVYMPCDERTIGINLSVYQDVLAEISSVCNRHNAMFVIIAGDFNTDIMRMSPVGTELKKFIDDEWFTS